MLRLLAPKTKSDLVNQCPLTITAVVTLGHWRLRTIIFTTDE